MQPFSFFFVGYSLGGGGGISGRVRALNLTVPLGSGRVGSDNLGYGPGSGFSFEPVQTSSLLCFHLLSAGFLIGCCFVSRDNLQIKRAFVLGVPPKQQDF